MGVLRRRFLLWSRVREGSRRVFFHTTFSIIVNSNIIRTRIRIHIRIRIRIRIHIQIRLLIFLLLVSNLQHLLLCHHLHLRPLVYRNQQQQPYLRPRPRPQHPHPHPHPHPHRYRYLLLLLFLLLFLLLLLLRRIALRVRRLIIRKTRSFTTRKTGKLRRGEGQCIEHLGQRVVLTLLRF